MALVLILLPFQLLVLGRLTLPAMFLTLFVIVILFIFRIFPSAYGYLNNYIITSRNSGRSLAVLRGLDVLKRGYDYVKDLVTGRYALMLLLSFGAWLLESAVLFGVSGLYGIPFTTATFSDYISSILSTSYNALMRIYTFWSVILIAALTLVSFIVLLFARKRLKRKKDYRL